jgi:SAM-dependent methyltransferase
MLCCGPFWRDGAAVLVFLKAITDRLISNPTVYDLVMRAFGARYIFNRLLIHLNELPADIVVLDIGGGTGNLRSCWPHRCRYVCLDTDILKLRRFRAKGGLGEPIIGDGARVPIRDASVDVGICIGVSHHMDDETLSSTLSEFRRVLKPGGQLIFLDGVLKPRLAWRIPIVRLLWAFDRGSQPRSESALIARLREHLGESTREHFGYFHEYLLWVGAAPARG